MADDGAKKGTRIETLYIEWRAEFGQFKDDIAQIRKELEETKNTIRKSAEDAMSSTERVKELFRTLGMLAKQLGLTYSVARAVRSAFNELKTSIRLAMDIHEDETLFETSLGNMADATREWSHDVADALGVSAHEIRRTVGLWYTMGESMGLTAENALTMSRNLNLLKQDIMSFYNIGGDQADTMIKSIYSGESIPFKNIGIVMNETMAKQALYRAGLAKVGDEIDTTMMMVGRYLTVMEQTGTAHGDMARTVDSPVNQLRRFEAALQDIRVSLGEAFMPVVQTVIPALQNLALWVKANTQLMDEVSARRAKTRTSGLQTDTSLVNKAVVEGGDAWADYGKKASASLDKTAAGVKKLRGMVFGLDEIHFETDPNAGGGGGGALNPFSMDQPTLPEMEVPDAIDSNIEEYKNKLRGVKEWIDNHTQEILWGLRTNFFTSLPTLYLELYAKFTWLMQEALGGYDFFPDDVSSKTIAKLGPFFEIWTDVDTTIKEFAWSGQKITEEAADAIATAYEKMSLDVQNAFREQSDNSYKSMEELFKNTSTLSEEEEAAILENMKKAAEEKQEQIQKYNDEVAGIYKKASEENRALTKEEQERVNEIQQKMKELAIEAMTESADEQTRILSHLTDNVRTLSARQAADVVKNSYEAKEKAVADAIDKANETISAAKRMKEAGKIDEETYNKIVAAAEQQRDDTIAAAEEKHRRVVEEAQKQAGEHVNKVDWETGEIKSRWRLLKESFTEKWTGIKDWFEENVKPWFTYQKWQELFLELLRNITNIWADIKKEIGERVQLPKIKMPHFTVSYDASWGGGVLGKVGKTIGDMLGIPGMPKLDVKWYAGGGWPEKGDLFFANEQGPEFVGRMGQRNVVANQMQIVEGVADGVRRAMRDMQQGADGDFVFNVYVDGELSHTERISRRNLRAGRTIIPVRS